FYIPWKNDPLGNFQIGNLIVRSAVSPEATASWMRSETAKLDSALPVQIETMDERVSKLTQRPKFNAFLLSLFAAIAILLAAIGVYGVAGYLVTQRTQEIGVRMALGASPDSILSMILRQSFSWTFAGAAMGLLGSWFATGLLQSLLFGVHARDP